jgi:hypothetical protein
LRQFGIVALKRPLQLRNFIRARLQIRSYSVASLFGFGRELARLYRAFRCIAIPSHPLRRKTNTQIGPGTKRQQLPKWFKKVD